MIASLLTEDTLILDNVPRLADVTLLQRILNNHGVDALGGKRPGDTAYQGQTLHISSEHTFDTTAPYGSPSRKCGRVSGSSGRWSRAWERPGFRCQAAAPSARGRSTSSILALQSLGAEIEIDGGT